MTETARVQLRQGSAQTIELTLKLEDGTPVDAEAEGWTFEGRFGNQVMGTVKTWNNGDFDVSGSVVTLQITSTDIVVAPRLDYRLQIEGNDGSNAEMLLDLAVELLDSLSVAEG